DKEALESALTRFVTDYEEGWIEMMFSKLGLKLLGKEQREEEEALLSGLDEILQLHETDMTLFYRLLVDFDTDTKLALSDVISEAFYHPEGLAAGPRAKIDGWGRAYAERLRRDAIPAALRREQMNAVNPCYVLRNYLAQEAIDLALEGDNSMLEDLYRM